MRKLIALAALLAAAPSARAADPRALPLDPETRYQTFEGWGIVLPCWLFRTARTLEKSIELYDKGPTKSPYSEALNAALAAEMVGRGFNRFRLEVGPQVEFRNDNDDPNTLNPDAFRFAWQDCMVREQLLPMKRLLDARGEPTVVYISYDLRSAATPDWLLEPAEYAEMALATLTHLKNTFDLEPNYWSVLNEPGNGGRPGDPGLYARLTAATGKRLAAAGFATKMSGPECVTPGQVDAYMKALSATPGALEHFAQITYHLYRDPGTIRHRRTIRDWAAKLGVTAAQTEWMEQKDLAVAEHIHLCLTEANAVAWERYAWDVGTNVRRQSFRRQSTAWYVRQYSRTIRPGAVRVAIGGGDDTLRPVAFLTPEGKAVVVIINKADRPRTVRLDNLPPGQYTHSGVGGGTIGKPRTADVGEAGTLELTLRARAVTAVTGRPPPETPPLEGSEK